VPLLGSKPFVPSVRFPHKTGDKAGIFPPPQATTEMMSPRPRGCPR
jgi:hypothetical protein